MQMPTDRKANLQQNDRVWKQQLRWEAGALVPISAACKDDMNERTGYLSNWGECAPTPYGLYSSPLHNISCRRAKTSGHIKPNDTLRSDCSAALQLDRKPCCQRCLYALAKPDLHCDQLACEI